jgi:hypothetical protein
MKSKKAQQKTVGLRLMPTVQRVNVELLRRYQVRSILRLSLQMGRFLPWADSGMAAKAREGIIAGTIVDTSACRHEQLVNRSSRQLLLLTTARSFLSNRIKEVFYSTTIDYT